MEITDNNIIVVTDSIEWRDVLHAMPLGSQVAIIEGDPKVAGAFTLRHKIPANWKVMPHLHISDEHITVIEGCCYLGIGEKYDEEKAIGMPTGTFTVVKSGTAHYFFSKKGCIIQVHGNGPQKITYINSDHDPRTKK